MLRDYLELHYNPYFNAPDTFWKKTVKSLASEILRTNIDISIEDMAVFGVSMDPNMGIPIKFTSKPSRFYTHAFSKPLISGSKYTLYDGFVEEAHDIIRGTVAQSMDSPGGFVRLDASSYINPLFIVTQVQHTISFLTDIGFNPEKDLVFPEKTRDILTTKI